MQKTYLKINTRELTKKEQKLLPVGEGRNRMKQTVTEMWLL